MSTLFNSFLSLLLLCFWKREIKTDKHTEHTVSAVRAASTASTCGEIQSLTGLLCLVTVLSYDWTTVRGRGLSVDNWTHYLIIITWFLFMCQSCLIVKSTLINLYLYMLALASVTKEQNPPSLTTVMRRD